MSYKIEDSKNVQELLQNFMTEVASFHDIIENAVLEDRAVLYTLGAHLPQLKKHLLAANIRKSEIEGGLVEEDPDHVGDAGDENT